MQVDINTRIQELRQKSLDEGLTTEEGKEAIALIRQTRSAATTTAKKKATSKKVVDSNELLSELEGL